MRTPEWSEDWMNSDVSRLPMELRKVFGIEERDSLEIYVEDDKIILKKYAPTDIFTGDRDDLIEFHGKMVSKKSIEELAKKANLI